MSKKSATIFDFINGITHQKKRWEEWSDMDRKAFSPYMINRWLSMRMELIEVINELQKYTIGILSPANVYKLYHGFLPSSKAFAKYIKGKKEEKYDSEMISLVAKHYQVNSRDAREYIELLGKDSCAQLILDYGYDKKAIKKMLKGI